MIDIEPFLNDEPGSGAAYDPNREIPFTQFLRPDGRTRPAYIERPADVVVKAKAILRAGGRFEIEELRTGTVSATVEHPDWEREDRGPVAIQHCPNGPQVPDMITLLVHAAHGRLCSVDLSEDKD